MIASTSFSASFVTDTHRRVDQRVLDLSVQIARHHAHQHSVPTTTTTTSTPKNINLAWRTNLTNAIDHLRSQLALLHTLATANPPHATASDPTHLAASLTDLLRDTLANHYSVLPPLDPTTTHNDDSAISHAALLDRHRADPTAQRLFHDFETLTWFLLGKYAATAYTHLMQAMLDQTLAVQREAAYWRELHPGWYFAMSTPTRFLGLFRSRHPFRSLLVWNPKSLVDQLAAFKLLGSTTTPTGSLTTLVHMPVHLAAQEMQRHVKALTAAQRVFAGQLGKLYDVVMHQDGDDAYAFSLAAAVMLDKEGDPLTQLKVHVSTLVDTMHQVQRRTQALASSSSVASSQYSDTASGDDKHDDDSDDDDDRPLLSALTTTHLLPSPARTLTQLIAVATHLPTPRATTSSILALHARPSRLTRAWLPLTTTALAATLAAQQVQLNLPTLHAAGRALVQFTRNAVTDWLLVPLRNMYETIRYREHRLAVMGARSLAADLESLERMVLEYARSADRGLSPEDLARVRAAVREGDLDLVLRDYEQGVQQPLKSALLGPLLTLMLIQVQKTKVDLELAMAALDKLLKANELNFGLLAVVPAVALGWWSVRKVREWVGARASGSVVRARARFVKGLWVVEKVAAATSAGTTGQVDQDGEMSVQVARSAVPSLGGAPMARKVRGRKAGESSSRTEAHVKLGLTLIEVNYLKHLVTKMGLTTEVQHMLLSDLRDVEQAPAAGPEINVALERIHRLVVRYNVGQA